MKINISGILTVTWMRKLKISGLPAAIKLVFSTFDEFRDVLTHSYFEELMDRLALVLSRAEMVKHTSRKREKTELIADLRVVRANLLSGINRMITGFKVTRFEKYNEQGAYVYQWYKGRTQGINEGAQLEVSDYIRSIQVDLDNDADLIEALQELNLLEWFSELIRVEDLYLKAYFGRSRDWATIQKSIVSVEEVKEDAVQEIKSLYNFLNDMIRVEGIDVYEELLITLRENLKPLRALVTKRSNAKGSEIDSTESPLLSHLKLNDDNTTDEAKGQEAVEKPKVEEASKSDIEPELESSETSLNSDEKESEHLKRA